MQSDFITLQKRTESVSSGNVENSTKIWKPLGMSKLRK